MLFKTAILYRLHNQSDISAADLEDALSDNASNPLGNQEARRIGWTQPGGRKSQVFLHEIQGQRLITALRQERMLPASVVAEELEERAEEIESREGRKLRRQEKQEIKEQIYEELLPRAFIRSKKIDLWWDSRRQLICVNSSSRKMAEEALDLLRETLGSLKVTPLATQELPVRGMTRWISDPSSRPNWLLLGDQAQLKASGDDASFTARQADLEGEEVAAMLGSGHHVTKAAVEIEGLASFVLTDDLSLKSIRFADRVIEEANNYDDDGDPLVRMETDFVLMADTLADVIEQMIGALGGEANTATPADSEAGATAEKEALEPA